VINTFNTPRIAFLQLTARRHVLLLALGGLSASFYLFGLLLPYNIFALKAEPLLDISKLTRHQPVTQAAFVFTFVALFALYYLAWRLCRGRQSRMMWIALLTVVVVINLAMLFLYPIGAADIFDNIIRGRMTIYHALNPFYDAPDAIRSDPFYPYVAWNYYPSAYGALWELLASALTFLAGNNFFANFFAFKILNLIFYFLSIVIIIAILKRLAPHRALQSVCLFALNPLMIYEIAGNGHNDIVMAFFVLLAIHGLVRRRFTLSLLALTAGAMIKFIPVLLTPIFLVVARRLLPTRKERFVFLIRTALVCLTFVIALYAPFWRGGDVLGVGRRSTLFTASLPALAQVQLEKILGEASSQQAVIWIALALTMMVILIQTFQAWQAASPESVIRSSTFILLFYLIFTCLWFQQWYVIWALALAALLPEGVLGRIAALLTYTAPWKMIAFDFFINIDSLPPRIWRETWLGLSTFGVAWLYVTYVALRPSAMQIFLRPLRTLRNTKNFLVPLREFCGK